MRQFLDVEAARRDFGGHQRRDAVFLEILECAHARVLALVAMDGHGRDAGALQLLREPVGAVLGAREHQHLVPVAFLDQVREQVALVLLRNAVGALLHLVGGGVTRRDLHRYWIFHERIRQLADLVGVGSREHQVLALLRQHLEDALDVADESHVEHAVGFIEDEDLHLGEIHGALFAQVEQAARRRDQDVAAVAHVRDLRALGHAAEDHLRAQVTVLAVVGDALRHLGGEFARGREHQRARVPAGSRA